MAASDARASIIAIIRVFVSSSALAFSPRAALFREFLGESLNLFGGGVLICGYWNWAL